jgi:hypothetical protein
MVRTASRHARNRRAVLEPTPLPPTTRLLSAQEAKERLREIVKGFFFWRRDGKEQAPARHMLVRSPPGLGKTKEAMEWTTRYQTERDANWRIALGDITEAGVLAQVAIFVPRHALAREIQEVIERNLAALGRSVNVPILRGRDHDAENGAAPCRRWREARELGHKGLPVYSNLCRRSQEGRIYKYPHFDACDGLITAVHACRKANSVLSGHVFGRDLEDLRRVRPNPGCRDRFSCSWRLAASRGSHRCSRSRCRGDVDFPGAPDVGAGLLRRSSSSLTPSPYLSADG